MTLWVKFLNLKKKGYGDIITFISHYKSSDLIDNFSHQKYDGLSAFQNKIARELKVLLQMPKKSLKNEKIGRKLIETIKFFSFFLPQKTKWKNLDTNAAYKAQAFSWRVLTKESTKSLLAELARRDLSLNSGLIYYLNQVIAEDFLRRDERCYRWLLPVNLREDDPHPDQPKNQTGSVSIFFDKDLGISNIDKSYKKKLSRTSAKASLLLLGVVSRLPDKLLNFVLSRRHKKVYWLGSFSNLGVWNIEGKAEEFGDLQAISFCPPAGTPNFPIGVGVITCNGHLSICIRIHPALNLSINQYGCRKEINFDRSIYTGTGRGVDGVVADYVLDRLVSTLREVDVL